MRRVLTYGFVAGIVGLSIIVLSKNYEQIIDIYFRSAVEQAFPFITAILTYLILFRNRFGLIKNLFHELTHIVFAFLLFEQVEQLYVSRTSGEVVINSEKKNILISLSPYFFPLGTLILLVFIPNVPWRASILSISYGLYIAHNVSHLVKNKSEILEFSWYGILFILILNFWISLIVFSSCSHTLKELIKLLNIL